MTALGEHVSHGSAGALWRMANDPGMFVSLDDIRDEPDPDRLDAGLMRAGVAGALCSLRPREERAIRLYYGFGGDGPCTLVEVGEELCVARERARQIIAKALRKLKHSSRSRKLLGFIDFIGLESPAPVPDLPWWEIYRARGTRGPLTARLVQEAEPDLLKPLATVPTPVFIPPERRAEAGKRFIMCLPDGWIEAEALDVGPYWWAGDRTLETVIYRKSTGELRKARRCYCQALN